MPSKRLLTGQRFHRLVVLSQAEGVSKRVIWHCLCDCGNTTDVPSHRLISGHTKSCGCRKKETGAENGRKNAQHGMTKSRTWVSWSAMVYRCTNTNGRQYSTYQGMLCDRWLDFNNFLSDMGERPDGTSIDRIDVKKGYSPENCRWATSKQQQRNRNNTRYLDINGQRVSLMEVAEALGIKKTAAQYFFSVSLKLVNEYGFLPSPENDNSNSS